MSDEWEKELEHLKEKKLAELAASKNNDGEKKMSHPYMELTDENFDSTISGSKIPVLVDFWAAWCGPCMSMGPIFEQLANKYEGKAILGKMNVDENQKVPGKFGIYGIPTFIVFKDGKEVGRVVGAGGAKPLEDELAKHL
jgi:thioredoxin 1